MKTFLEMTPEERREFLYQRNLRIRQEKLEHQRQSRENYYKAHREEILRKRREAHAAAPEKTAQQNREYRRKHPEKAREKDREKYRRWADLHPFTRRLKSCVAMERYRAKKREGATK